MAVTCLMVAATACSGEVGDGAAYAGGAGGDAFGGSSGHDGGTAGAGGSTGGSGGSGGGVAGSGGIAGSGGSTGGSSGSGGASGGSGGDPIEPPAGRVPMFVAQGHAGRTVVSCDDGLSWVADRSDEAGDYCSQNDCDHGPGAGRGITYGDGWFFATFGWGSPGKLVRSRNGIDWEPLVSGTTFGGVIFGNGRLVAVNRLGHYSDDLGTTWSDFGSVELDGWTIRDSAFVPHAGGRFLMSADTELVVSSDAVNWAKPASIPAGCAGGSYQGRIIYGNGTIVITAASGLICYSTNGGETWSSKPIADSLMANGVWNGSEFMAWGNGTVYRSSDGQNWTSTPMLPSDIEFGVTAVNDRGTIVGINKGWQQHYDAQRFYRSEDGVNWETLPSGAYTGSHQINVIAFGYGQPSEHCPL